ncbi:MAG TPA: AI-2E family transporter [Bryobacteraceae bacterium]|nr:AI-2E family transporter [Bryobacteraceae bacterium]
MPESASNVGMNDGAWLDRDRLRLIVLLAVAVLLAIVCFRIVAPFLPALTWALALAIVAWPVHERISRTIDKPDLAAGLAVAAVTVLLIAPVVLVVQQAGSQLKNVTEQMQDEANYGAWREKLKSHPKLAGIAALIESNVDLTSEENGITARARRYAGRVVKGTVWGIVELCIAMFALFFFFRDRREIMTTLRSLVPLSTREVDDVFTRIRDMVHATVYGTVVVSLVQGALGGLMFWVLGLPAPVLWGAAMALVALVPVLGAFVVWAPAALYLGLEGQWSKAAILAAWGTVVVSLVDNLLYPALVGREVRLHTLPVFLALVGGMYVFGAAGIVIGPVALAVMLALINILRSRTTAGRPAEQPV